MGVLIPFNNILRTIFKQQRVGGAHHSYAAKRRVASLTARSWALFESEVPIDLEKRIREPLLSLHKIPSMPDLSGIPLEAPSVLNLATLLMVLTSALEA